MLQPRREFLDKPFCRRVIQRRSHWSAADKAAGAGWHIRADAHRAAAEFPRRRHSLRAGLRARTVDEEHTGVEGQRVGEKRIRVDHRTNQR